MADRQHTQTRPKFTWLFLAIPKHSTEFSAVVLRIDADTKAVARAAFPDMALTFAAKIRTESPYMLTWTDVNRATLWSVVGCEIKSPVEVHNA